LFTIQYPAITDILTEHPSLHKTRTFKISVSWL